MRGRIAPLVAALATAILLICCNFPTTESAPAATPSPSASSPTPAPSAGVAPILVSIVMHNEEPRTGQYPDFVEDEEAFWEHRSGLVRFVEMLRANGVAFNYQSDWNFLMAVGLYDTGTPATCLLYTSPSPRD